MQAGGRVPGGRHRFFAAGACRFVRRPCYDGVYVRARRFSHAGPIMSESDPDRQKARARAQAEQRILMQAMQAMQAKRAGKMPVRADTTGSEVVTALFVIVAVIGMLVLVMRHGG